jgi:hypothetical protein
MKTECGTKSYNQNIRFSTVGRSLLTGDNGLWILVNIHQGQGTPCRAETKEAVGGTLTLPLPTDEKMAFLHANYSH